jgi:hypothetical protein
MIVIAGLDVQSGDMADTFADRQVDGSDLVSGEENTILAVI